MKPIHFWSIKERKLLKFHTACGIKLTDHVGLRTFYLVDVTCQECRKTKEFQEGLYELEIGFDGNSEAYENSYLKKWDEI